jgi:hypothetical protein
MKASMRSSRPGCATSWPPARWTGAGAVRINRGLENLREMFKWLEFGQVAVDVHDALIWGSLPTSPIMIEHYAARPPADDLSRAVKPACARPTGYVWEIDRICQNAACARQQQSTGGGGGDTGLPLGKMIRDTDGYARLVTQHRSEDALDSRRRNLHLPQQALRDRLGPGQRRPARLPAGIRPLGDDATCDGSRPPTRKITKQDNPDLAAVLRIDDGPASWVVLGGYRYAIPSGTEFTCWVNPQYRANIEFDVYDFVTPTELQTWPIGNGTISNCGDPEHPTF